MKNRIYYNPLNRACKNIVGAVAEGEKIQLNLFYIHHNSIFNIEQTTQLPSRSDCSSPQMNAFLQINKDGGQVEVFEMQKTLFGWTISFCLNEIGLYYYTFYILS